MGVYLSKIFGDTNGSRRPKRIRSGTVNSQFYNSPAEPRPSPGQCQKPMAQPKQTLRQDDSGFKPMSDVKYNSSSSTGSRKKNVNVIDIDQNSEDHTKKRKSTKRITAIKAPLIEQGYEKSDKRKVQNMSANGTLESLRMHESETEMPKQISDNLSPEQSNHADYENSEKRKVQNMRANNISESQELHESDAGMPKQNSHNSSPDPTTVTEGPQRRGPSADCFSTEFSNVNTNPSSNLNVLNDPARNMVQPVSHWKAPDYENKIMSNNWSGTDDNDSVTKLDRNYHQSTDKTSDTGNIHVSKSHSSEQYRNESNFQENQQLSQEIFGNVASPAGSAQAVETRQSEATEAKALYIEKQQHDETDKDSQQKDNAINQHEVLHLSGKTDSITTLDPSTFVLDLNHDSSEAKTENVKKLEIIQTEICVAADKSDRCYFFDDYFQLNNQLGEMSTRIDRILVSGDQEKTLKKSLLKNIQALEKKLDDIYVNLT